MEVEKIIKELEYDIEQWSLFFDHLDTTTYLEGIYDIMTNNKKYNQSIKITPYKKTMRDKIIDPMIEKLEHLRRLY